jgi:hypothetical protein
VLPNSAKTGRGRRWVCCALAALAIVVSPLHSAPGRYITVAWDPSPDGVAGYAVYVGTDSGKYDQVFVVRNQTYFTYADAVPDRRYYFAVVAYTESLVSNPSQEVSGYGQSTPALPVSRGLAVQDAPRSVSTLNSTRGLLVASTERRIDALAALGDGRVLIVEDGRQIRVFDGHTLLSEPALEASQHVTFMGVAVDPRLEPRRRVYVEEAERRDDGTRELRIVRYRDVQNTLGEPAVIVAGIQLSEVADAPFTVDSEGRIFVAVPQFGSDGTGSAAVVFGFESDGGALRSNRAASPVVSWAPSKPTAIAWDDRTQQLWLAGSDETGPTVVRVPVNPLTSSEAWPRVPQRAIAVPPEIISARASSTRNGELTSPMLLMRTVRGDLVRVLPDANAFAEVPQATQEEEATATSTDPQTKSTYVATRVKFGAASYIYKIANQ